MAVLNNESKLALAVPRSGAVAVGRFVAPIAGQVLSRRGAFMTELISHWSAIAGPGLAAYTMPVKLSKNAPKAGPAGTPSPSLLHLRVEPGRALEVQYVVPQLIERINRTLGFEAVSALRVVQAPVSGKLRPVRTCPPPVIAERVASREDRLSAAFNRMGAAVKARGLSG